MKWSEYSALALRTESIPTIQYLNMSGLANDNFDMNEEREINTAIFTRATRLLHAAMGLVTETVELLNCTDRVNLIEEVGDCYWYLAIIADVFPVPEDAFAGNHDPVKAMAITAAELIDTIGKRHIFYGKDLDTYRVCTLTTQYTKYLSYFCKANKIEPSDAWEANIKKLEKRYPNLRFDGEHAVNRNVANELSHIEMSEDLKHKDVAYGEEAPVMQEINQVEGTAFNSILRNDFTPNQIERIAMGLAFELGAKFKKQGMDILATAMGDVYRTYSGRGDKLSDLTVYGMYEMLGYPLTVEGVLAIAHSILRTPSDGTGNNSSAG